ncbi:chemotaxis protein CheW [Microcoleus vaginatus PCC 9802]|uniref:chemotaxis protein CheW n=1 Tax=Microcoleus vaginatus TaxID=119532 RepID=UPI00020D2149|nr:CheW protein [Microcoleus vaginatus FGP-2]UNU19978.1 chemotaxis protein CheW [Microcoleus vaginatus PCC 9802]
MDTKPYLIFEQNGFLCGIEACYVREIFFLPELTAIAEAPQDIVGAIDLRGEILPVMDLNLRFGYAWQEYSVTDSTIVIEWQEFKVGIIVNQVREVKELSEDAITSQLSYGRDHSEASHHFVAGFARCEADIIMLLNLDRLIRYSPKKLEESWPVSPNNAGNQETAGESDTESLQWQINAKLLGKNPQILSNRHVFRPQATPEEKAIFQSRTNNLRLRGKGENDAAINMSLAVFVLNGEYFGIPLDVVREFTDINQVTPVPCTPDRIVGNMNLRGEILTLIDIRSVLNMSLNMSEAANYLSKAIVVEVGDLVAGIVVDEILDIIYLNVSEMAAVPAALHSANREYLRGTAIYGEKMMAILSLQKLLTKGEVVVDEEV